MALVRTFLRLGNVPLQHFCNSVTLNQHVRFTVQFTTELPRAHADRLLLTDRSTFCVLADKLSLKVRNIIAKDVYDVVHTNWLQRCIEQQKLLNW